MMRYRYSFVVISALLVGLMAGTSQVSAQIKIKIGKLPGGSGFHIPSYVAMERGFYKEEGLDATFVNLVGKAQVTAGMTGAIDFSAIVSGSAQATLSGAELRYVVGEALKSHWVIISKPSIAKPEDLRGKIVGYGRQGSADYDEGAAVMLRAFKMSPGKDYKVISLPGEPDRVAALINGSIDAGLVTVPHVPAAINGGQKVLLRVGDYIQRAGGTIWTRKAFVDQHPEAIPKFIRAIAKAIMYYRTNKEGSMAILKKVLGVKTDKDAEVVWEQTKDTYGAELPKESFRQIFESRRQAMIAGGQWAKDKPLPDPEQWLLRDVLEKTLAEMKYEPAKL
ncbi:MAG: ABC transporter substrate-binding protein [Hyphomicrobiaceae bacterium]